MIGARHPRDDVLRRHAVRLAGVGELDAAGDEVLEVTQAAGSSRRGPAGEGGIGRDRAEAQGGVATREPGGGAVVAGRPRAATLEPIVSEIGDVAPDAVGVHMSRRSAAPSAPTGGAQHGDEKGEREAGEGAWTTHRSAHRLEGRVPNPNRGRAGR